MCQKVYSYFSKIIQDRNLPNVLLKPFIPQKELMDHEKIVAFISHGGGNSVFESLYFGTPIIGLPIQVDQFAGVERVEQVGAGFHL